MKPFCRTIRTARHEAAHAVVAEACGYRVRRVWLLAEEAGFTETWYPILPDPMARAIIALAGHAAEMRWHRQPAKLIEAGDHRTVRAMGFRGRSYPTLLALARGTVDEHAVAIEAVAQALRKSDLTGRDVRRIIRETQGAAK